MQELTNQKTMTIKEIANVVDCNYQTVRRKVKEIFPELIRNGKTTHLNEINATIVIGELKAEVKKQIITNKQENNMKELLALQNVKVEKRIDKIENMFERMLEAIPQIINQTVKSITESTIKQLEPPNKITVKEYCLSHDLSSYNPKQLFIKAGRKAMELSKQLNRTVIFKKDGEYNVGCYDEDIVKHSVGIVLIEQDKERDLFNL